MDLEGIMLCEINQTENDKYYIISLICEICKHTHKNKTETKQKTTKNSQKKRSELWLSEVEGCGRGNWRKVVKRSKVPLII